MRAAEILARVVIAHGPEERGNGVLSLKKRLTPRGLIYKDSLYLALTKPDDETPAGETHPYGRQVMRLAVVEMADVAELRG